MELWFVYALGAAACWGFGYALSEHVLKSAVSPAALMFVYAAMATPIYAIIATKNGTLQKSLSELAINPKLFGALVLVAVASIAANLMIFDSISQKNATLASLIELTYPLFTVFFIWLIFGKIDLNIGIISGALMIACGAMVVYKFS